METKFICIIKEKIVIEQFSLEEYLKNPDRKIITRDGKSARIICTDRVCKTHTILALLFEDEDREEVYQYTSKGEYYPNASSPHDLFFVPVKKEGWVNVYKYRSRCTHLSGIIYSSKEEAESDAEVHESGINTYITTIKIKWKE